MKLTSIIFASLMFAAACGGKTKSTTPANNVAAPSTQTTTAKAPGECSQGQALVDGACEQMCLTDADCPEMAPRCLEVAGADERAMNDDGTAGPVLEPLRACGIDH